jgi:integration host factor subunit alpha
VTKADLIEIVNSRTSVAKHDCNRLVDDVFDTMRDALAAGDPVMISGFGRFAVRAKRARVGRNPRTGAPVEVTARRVVTFKPSAGLRDSAGRAARE